MTTIVLHIGMTKTGSSALQHLLARHQSELSRRGLYYAPELDLGRAGNQAVLGNGLELARYLSPRRRDEAFSPERFEAEFTTRWISLGSPLSLLSSEVLASGRIDMIQRFKERVAGDIPVRILAVVRDIYAHAWSAWMQLIKRHAYAEDFVTYCTEKYRNPQFMAVKRYFGVFPNSISLLHFESINKDLFENFLRAVDIDLEMPRDKTLINRSLSAAEIEVLRECNRRYRDPMISTYLSDLLMRIHPDRPKADAWFPEMAALLETRFARDVDWLNKRFFGGTPTLAITRAPARSDGRSGPSLDEVWSDVNKALAKRRLPVST